MLIFFYKMVGFTCGPVKAVEDLFYRRLKHLSPAARKKKSEPLRDCTLYHFQVSPFSWRVRKAVAHLDVELKMLDVLTNDQAWKELMAGGKRDQVPCLKIENPEKLTQWMYESQDIIQYLKQQVGEG